MIDIKQRLEQNHGEDREELLSKVYDQMTSCKDLIKNTKNISLILQTV